MSFPECDKLHPSLANYSSSIFHHLWSWHMCWRGQQAFEPHLMLVPESCRVFWVSQRSCLFLTLCMNAFLELLLLFYSQCCCFWADSGTQVMYILKQSFGGGKKYQTDTLGTQLRSLLDAMFNAEIAMRMCGFSFLPAPCPWAAELPSLPPLWHQVPFPLLLVVSHWNIMQLHKMVCSMPLISLFWVPSLHRNNQFPSGRSWAVGSRQVFPH